MHCELDFRHDANGSGETQFVRLGVTGTNGELVVELRSRVGGNLWYFLVDSPADGGISQSSSTAFALPAGKWIHLALDIGAAVVPLSATIDGDQKMVGDTFPTLDAITSPTTTLLDVARGP